MSAFGCDSNNSLYCKYNVSQILYGIFILILDMTDYKILILLINFIHNILLRYSTIDTMS